MGKTKNDLSASLLASFETSTKQADKPTLKPVEVPKAKKEGEGTKTKKSALKRLKTPNLANSSSKALRSTISYQQTEANAADEILDVLKAETGVRGGFSDAVKIALRLCSLEPAEIKAAWESTKQEDGRVLRHKS